MSDLFGFVGAFLTTLSFVPQALLVLRTGKTEGISLAMYALFTIGVAAWLAYGVLQAALPIILANAITLVLATLILTMKARAMLQARSRAQGAAEEISAPIAS
ncbi:SemiSWEET transporter [Hyphomonas sp.]|jgi:MtN3 and saliva related transmembrane protein|uniref:SemiSWEET transporter n=1 Tax=Hyphomonas sp. TaxID=87 RepID=UPI0025B7BE35|nr:SemiSWEET transporter [Hyphomonas sp.]